MSTLTKYRIEVPIDKLTNCIVNTISGDSFETTINPIIKSDLREKRILSKRGLPTN